MAIPGGESLSGYHQGIHMASISISINCFSCRSYDLSSLTYLGSEEIMLDLGVKQSTKLAEMAKMFAEAAPQAQAAKL